MSRFGTEESGGEVMLSPFFFDLLHLDGRDLVDEPTEVRLDALAGLLAADVHAALRMPGYGGRHRHRRPRFSKRR